MSYVMVSPGGMGHCVTPTAPSYQFVLLNIIPWACSAVPRSGTPRPLVAWIRMVSPVWELTGGGLVSVVARRAVGPGLTAMFH